MVKLDLSSSRDYGLFSERVKRQANLFLYLGDDVLEEGEKFPWDENCLMQGNYTAAAETYLNERILGEYFASLCEVNGLVVLENPLSRFGWPVSRRVAYDQKNKTKLELSVSLNGKEDYHEFELILGEDGMSIDEIAEIHSWNDDLMSPIINGGWHYSKEKGVLLPLWNSDSDAPEVAERLAFRTLTDYNGDQIQQAGDSALHYLRVDQGFLKKLRDS